MTFDSQIVGGAAARLGYEPKIWTNIESLSIWGFAMKLSVPASVAAAIAAFPVSRYAFVRGEEAESGLDIEEHWRLDAIVAHKGKDYVVASACGFELDRSSVVPLGAGMLDPEEAYLYLQQRPKAVNCYRSLYDRHGNELPAFSQAKRSGARWHVHVESIAFAAGFASQELLAAMIAAAMRELGCLKLAPVRFFTIGADAVSGLELSVASAHDRLRLAYLEPFAFTGLGELLMAQGPDKDGLASVRRLVRLGAARTPLA